MNETNFCYWLQGYFELNKSEELTIEQVKVIKEHLALAFNKVTVLKAYDSDINNLNNFDMNILKTPTIIC